MERGHQSGGLPPEGLSKKVRVTNFLDSPSIFYHSPPDKRQPVPLPTYFYSGNAARICHSVLNEKQSSKVPGVVKFSATNNMRRHKGMRADRYTVRTGN